MNNAWLVCINAETSFRMGYTHTRTGFVKDVYNLCFSFITEISDVTLLLRIYNIKNNKLSYINN